MKPDNTPLVDSAVQFKLQIRTPGTENCLLYEEVQSKDLSASSGTFAVTLNDGTGSRTDTSGYGLDQLFGNRTTQTFTFAGGACTVGTTYTPNVADTRKIVVQFKDSTMATWEPLPAQNVSYVPTAIEAYQVGGFPSNSLMRVENGSGPQPVSALTPAQAAALLSLSNGTSTAYVQSNSNGANLPSFAANPSSPTAGQVWYDSTNKLVKYYDGTSVQTVGSSLPSVGTAGTYTKVTTDAEGRVTAGTQITGADITSGTIGGSTSMSSTGTVTASAVSSTTDSTQTLRIFEGTNTNKVSITVPPSLAADYPLQLPGTLPASNGMALVSTTAGVMSWSAIGTGDFMKDGSVAMTAPLKITPTALPGSPTAGTLTFDSGASNALKYYDGSSWKTVGTGSGSGDFMKDGSVAMTGAFNGGSQDLTSIGSNITGSGAINLGAGGANNNVTITPTGTGVVTTTTPIKITPTALPATPAAGMLAFDSGASNALKFYNGSSWQTVGTGTGGGDFMKDGSVAMTGNFNAGGNSILGNTTASADLKLESTSNATKGNVLIQPNGGNVGIGTTSPVGYGTGGPILGIRGTAATVPEISLDATPIGGSNWVTVSDNNGNFYFRNVTTSNTPMTIHSNSYVDIDKIAVGSYAGTAPPSGGIIASGSVGIGTTAPTRLLDVNGPIHITPAALPSSPTAGELAFDSGASNALKFYNGSSWQTVGTGSGGGDFMKDGSVAMTGNFNAGGNKILGNTTASANLELESTSNATKGYVILQKNGGRVGIGTATPSAPLSIVASQSGVGDDMVVIQNTNNSGFSSINFKDDAGTLQAGIGYANSGTAFPSTFMVGSITAVPMTFGTAGVEAMRITTAGSVGIGTTTPTRLLDVAGPIHIAPAALPSSPTAGELAFDSGASNALKFYNGSSWQTVGTGGGSGDFMKDGSVAMTGNFNAGGQSVLGNTTASANLILESTSNATKGYVNLQPNGGNVGIGTTTPASILDLSKNANSETAITVRNPNAGASASAGLEFYNGGGNNGWVVLGGTSNSNPNIQGRIELGSPTGVSISAAGSGDVRFFTTGSYTERMRLTNAGNLAIGTTAANQLLTVEGPMSLRTQAAPTATANYGKIYVDSGDSDKLKYMNPAGSIIDLTAGGGSGFANGGNSFGANATLGTNDNFTLGFRTNNTVKMTIKANGNVGIGSTNPGDRLTVSGGHIALDNNKQIYFDGGSSSTAWAMGRYDGTGSGPFTMASITESNLSVSIPNLNSGEGFAVGRAGGNSVFEIKAGTGISYFRENVGIGTKTPNQLLTVEGPMSLRTQAAPTATANYGKIYVDSGDSDKLKYMNPAGTIKDLSATGNGDIKSDGTVSMAAKLQTVYATATAYSSAGSTSTPAATAIYVGNSSATNGAAAFSQYDVLNGSSVIQSGYSGFISNSSGFSPSFVIGQKTLASNYAESMRIDGSGNVGIGTTTPAGNLAIDNAGHNATICLNGVCTSSLSGGGGSSSRNAVTYSATPTVNWATSNIQSIVLTGNASLTFSGGTDGAKYTLMIVQDATGSRTITWPGNVRFPGGSPITLTTTGNKTDYIGFIYNGISSTYDAISFSQNY